MDQKNILIIEDDPKIIEILNHMLMRMGHRILDNVASGEDALTIIKAIAPDLLLVDIYLEGKLDGIQTAHQIKEIIDVPIIYLTGASDTETINRASQTTPFGYLVKPIKFSELNATIEIALHKHAVEKTLTKQRQLFSTTLQCMSEGLITTDILGNISYVNPTALNILDYTEHDVVNKNITEILKIIDDSTGENFIQYLVNEEHHRHENPSLFLVNRHNQHIPIELHDSPILTEENENLGKVFVLLDISARRDNEEMLRKYQDKLRSLANQLSLTDYQERRKYALELQESIGQLLALSKIKLANCLNPNFPSKYRESVQEAYNFIDESLQRVRTVSSELSPHALYEIGLEAGLEWLVENVNGEYDTKIEFYHDHRSKPLSTEETILLFQSTRELVYNILNHTVANRIRIGVVRRLNNLFIRITGDGSDFNSTEIQSLDPSGSKNSLFKIRERLVQLNGSIQVKSHPGTCTSVTLKCPLTKQIED